MNAKAPYENARPAPPYTHPTLTIDLSLSQQILNYA